MDELKDVLISSLVEGPHLAHYGVLGMKWGVRRYQPYSTRPRSSGKEGKEIGLAADKVIKKKGNTGRAPFISNDSNRPSNRDLNIIDTAPIVRADGSIVYPPVAEIYKQVDSRRDELPAETRAILYKEPGFDTDYNEVNPNYGQPGTTSNCAFCAAAVELSGKGYNVVARRSLDGATPLVFKRWFKDAKNEVCSNYDELKNDLLSDGNGSSGILSMYYGSSGLGSNAGGHSVHYRNENGNIIISDGQTHKQMAFDDIFDAYGVNPSGKVVFTRLDKCDPDWDSLAEDGALGLDVTERKWYRKDNDTVYDNF